MADAGFQNAGIPSAAKGTPGGVASLDENGKVPAEQSQVESVNGQSGPVALTHSDVGADAAGTALSYVDAHAAETVGVHGIADVTALVVKTDARLPQAAGQAPPVTTSLEARWDASSAGSLILDANGNVQQWNDLSGNGHHANNGTASGRPGLQRRLGGVSIPTFTTAGQSFQALWITNPGTLPFDGASVVFLVGFNGNNVTTTNVLSWGSSSSNNHRAFIAQSNSLVFRPNAVVASQHTVTQLYSNQPFLAATKITATTTTAQPYQGVWKGAAATGLTAFTNNTPTTGSIGFYNGTAFVGAFAEILIYKADLTDAQIESVLVHLANKWGV